MNRRDPRIRQTLNRISSTLENANLSTQASLFTFSQSYIAPCLTSLNTCLEASCYPCLGARRDLERRRRNNRMGRSTQRGRPELVFDFYNDDWDDPDDGESAGLLDGWGNDELDRLLAGSGSRVDGQPGRTRAMSYGSKGVRRKGLGLLTTNDPTTVPTNSMFGFLEKLPWRTGGRGVKYKPSAADLQDNPGRKSRDEAEALMEESDGEDYMAQKRQRKRSGTVTSRSTNGSLSSRGDLFPSEDEADAVLLDDEFAISLERRTNGTVTSDEASTSKKSGKRPSSISIRTMSSIATSKSPKSSQWETALPSAQHFQPVTTTPPDDLPTLEDLKHEEDQARHEQEVEIERNREVARRLAIERGLATRSPPPNAAETQTQRSAVDEDRPPDSQSHTENTAIAQRPDPSPPSPSSPTSLKQASSITTSRAGDSDVD